MTNFALIGIRTQVTTVTGLRDNYYTIKAYNKYDFWIH